MWLELTIKSKRILVGGFYRHPNSSLEYFNLLKESIDRACSTNIIDIIITGDFNYNMKNANNKISEITLEFNLTQLISEPTHFTEDSPSILDLILVRNKSNIIFSGVIDPFLPEQVRYHCPTIVLLKFLRPRTAAYKRRVWYYKLADYDKYRQLLMDSNIMEKIDSHTNIDQNVKDMTDAITKAAEDSIPHKTVTIRPNDPPWITSHIRLLIRKRKLTYRKFKNSKQNDHWIKYKTLRNTVISELRKSKQEYFEKLDKELKTTATQKHFGKLQNKFSIMAKPRLVFHPLSVTIHTQKTIMTKQKC